MSSTIPGLQRLTERRSERRRISVGIRYRRRIVRLAAKTLDISCHGLRLSGMERFKVGDMVWINLPGLETKRAKVVWVDRFEAGCAFIEPLHPAIFDAIIHGRLR